MRQPMIHVRAQKKLGEFFLNAEIRDEGFICLIGRNGAGKTTFLNAIAGVLELDEGYIKIGSVDVTRQSIDRRGIVLVTPQSSIPHMGVDKHLIWGRKLGGNRVEETYVEKIKNTLGISYSGKLQKLSLGMRERVSLATALLSEPKLILVDEAFSNIDNRTEFIEQYHRLCSQKGIDAIFTTQFAEDSKLADHSYLMEAGVSQKIS